MKLLLTGATGFVGRNILLTAMVRHAFEKIYVPVRSEAKLKAQLEQEGYASIPSVLRPFESSADDWRLGEAASAEHVIHAAGVIFARTWEQYRDTNIEGTMALMRALRAPSRIVVLSSLAAAGPSEEGFPRREGQPDSPVTWYGKSKLEMEQRLAKEFSDLPYVCLRPPMVFGPRDQATLPLFKMVRKPVHFKAGFRTKHYSFISVEDLTDAVFAALERPARQPQRYYYLAHGEPITDREILLRAAQVAGRPSRVVSVPQWALKVASRFVDGIPTWRATIPSLSVDRAKEIWPDRWEVSSAAFQKDFDWSARTCFVDSLRSTCEWYVRNGQL